MSGWEDALSAIVGARHVSTAQEALDDAARATFATSSRPQGIVRPGSRTEVQGVLRTAAAHGLSVYPVSGGKNWGLGSRVAPTDGALLLDLGRMNRIIEHDEEMAFVRLEPGVTFRELYEFLKAKGSRLYASTTGGSPDGSVIGNTLERGDGSGPLGDRAAAVCALEVVLPTGEVIHTGFDRFANARTAHLQRWGVGPFWTDCFCNRISAW